LPPHSELPKHNRPKAFENLVQITGKCKMEVFDEEGGSFEKVLNPGDMLRMEKGQFHIHSNPFDKKSYTLFKAEGDITEIMKVLRENFERIG
jgi:quercetin dioxygenase-like cupin family protein